MSYLAFYRKYRPSKFSEVIGQEPIIKILQQSIANNTISHAYLFYGPRGTGKTSIAKIFAKNVNCLNPINGERCEECENCLKIKENDVDIIEIDAASNNGVEEIREIRNNVKLSPTVGKYKIYIIDEVHMLSIGAFNALLKTLEEPPKHVIFILATTEIQKIPLTIISRCQRFDFKKINEKTMSNFLGKIAKEENKKITDDSLKLISNLSDGCVRDAVNLLDQLVSSNSEVKVEDIYKISGVTPKAVIEQMFENIVNNNIEGELTIIENLFQEGKNFATIASDILMLSRNININNNVRNYFSEEMQAELEKYNGIPNETTLAISNTFLELIDELRKTGNQKLLFEIKIFELLEKVKSHEIISREIISEEKNKINNENPILNEEKEEQNTKIISREIILTRINNVLAQADKTLLTEFKNKTKEYENYLSNKKYNSVSSILQKGIPTVCSDKYVLFTYKNDVDTDLFNSNITEIEKFILEVHGIPYRVIAISNDEWEKTKKKYIEDKNNGIIYSFKEEIKQEIHNNTIKSKTAIDIFGEENINIQ